MRDKLNIKTVAELAEKVGVSEGQLWRLTKKVDCHYYCWEVEKKNKPGESRSISAPIGILKQVQGRLHRLLSQQCDFGSFSHYGRKGRSNITNAIVHVGEKVVFTCDMKNFFPSIRPERVVRALIDEQKCSKKVAILIAKLVTHKFQLPQGAATSTDVANIITLRLQRRLGCLAKQWGLKFSILGDDITFSGGKISEDFVRRAKKILREEGFKIHPAKGGVFTKSERQMVTGINVAHGLSVRQEKRKWKTEYQKKCNLYEDGNIPEMQLIEAKKTYDGRMSYAKTVRKKKYVSITVISLA